MGDSKRFASKLAGYVVRFEKRFDLGFHELTLYGRDDHVFVWGAHNNCLHRDTGVTQRQLGQYGLICYPHYTAMRFEYGCVLPLTGSVPGSR